LGIKCQILTTSAFSSAAASSFETALRVSSG
jgi:hypothetical protein